MESISRLRAVLVNSLGPRGSQRGEQGLFDELMIHKERLLHLFDVGSRNAQEQREIQSGKTSINNQSVAINADFARQVIFLSQHLDCSERYVAAILHRVMVENPNMGPIYCLEAAIAEFHQRRRHLVDSLRFIFEAAETASMSGASSVYTRIDTFVRQELIPAVPVPGGEVSLAYRIFKEIGSLEILVSKAQEAKQRAGSTSCDQGSIFLGYDILNSRYDSLKYERRGLATSLCLLARLGYFSPCEIQKIVDWLAENPNHAMTYYMLTAILTSFDPVDPQSVGGKIRRTLAVDTHTLSFMTKKLNQSTAWRDPGLKATILLKWTLFLTEARHCDPVLEHQSGFKTEELEGQVWDAVQGDAFTYLALAVIQLQRRQVNLPTSYISSRSLSVDQEPSRELPVEDMKPIILQTFEALVRSLLTHASSELRKIKQRQEDIVHTSARSDRIKPFRSSTLSNNTRFSSAPDSNQMTHSPRNDIAMLYSFIGLLYSALPDERALQFWASEAQFKSHRMAYLEFVETTAGKLPAFLQWAVWSTQTRDIDLSTALYDMLAGLAKGQQCSELAYNFMARGAGEVIPGSALPLSNSAHYGTGPTVSWTVMFGLLESWVPPSQSGRTGHLQPNHSDLRPSQSWTTTSSATPTHQVHQPPSLGLKDVLLAQAFLRFLSRVVTDSVAVRLAISGHAHFHAIHTLVSLIPLGIPLELKGTLFDTLASFCQPGAGAAGVEICKAVWTLMERLEVINVRGVPDSAFATGSNLLQSVKGVEAELEEIEAMFKMYPATIAFLNLLSTLIHTPKSLPLKDRIMDAEPINTIPDTLGQPYRHPGISPYISFVVDNVFSNIPNREYTRPSERWQINDLCLCFVERVLASYDLESLIGSIDDSRLKADFIVSLLVHPGYDIMKRLLTQSPLQASILSYIVDGVEGFGKDFTDEEPHFQRTIVRLLRIVHRVLELQDIFLDVLVPLLADLEHAPIVDAVHSRSYFTRFDQALSFGPRYIPAIAAYVAYPAHAELVLLSVNILNILSASSAFSNLTTLIERCSDSERILTGFEQIMKSETTQSVAVAETMAEQTTGAGAHDPGVTSDNLEQAVRLAVLQLFIENTEPDRPYPNIAHFILFGGTNEGQLIQDPHALGARQTSIHVLIDLLNAGVPSRKGKHDKKAPSHSLRGDPLYVTLPGLAERCYRVIYQLCVHPRSSDLMMRYLRTREDFFARQLSVISFKVPETTEDPFVEVVYVDGSRVATTVCALTSFLRLCSWIFDLVALELHILTSQGHHKGVMELLGILLGSEDTNHDRSTWGGDATQPFQDLGQSHMRIIQFVHFLNFNWSDSLIVRPTELQLLGHLNLQSCIRVDATGCEVVDRAAVMTMMVNAKHVLHSQGNIVTPAHTEQLMAEMTYILESCAVENHRRQVCHATATSYEAWRRLLDITLIKCFTQLPYDRRENMLFDLLHTLSTTIASANIQESTAILLSETILSSITKLREDRRHQIIIQSRNANARSLPAERLLALLRSILECILESNRLDLVRGNLYASLINYLHLIYSDDVDKFSGEKMSSPQTPREDFDLGNSQSVDRPHILPSPLEASTLAAMKHSFARFVAIASRDAIDGTEVWKTVTFMLLDSLVHLCRLDAQQVLLTALVRHGILSNFVQGVKESDLRLQSVLKPDPDDLNPLYVYEAKMSLFIRIAQTRHGAERLLEAQLLPTLAQCDYLDARPEVDQSFMDQNSFLPSAVQRYHQLFVPALLLVNGMLASLGSTHGTAANQALEFLSSHKDTVAILLKAETNSIPLVFVEEFHLLISLCAIVLPLLPTSELLSPSGFGAIHEAILTLAARCLGNRDWILRVKPQNDAEMLEDYLNVPDDVCRRHPLLSEAHVWLTGHGPKANFALSARREELQLRKAIIAYIGATSRFTEPKVTPILSPVSSVSHQNEQGSRFSATIPTLGDTVEALGYLCGDVADTLKHISDLSAELASKDRVGVENVNEIIASLDIRFAHDLDIGQKRSIVCHELKSIADAAKDGAKTLLDTTEMLLLVLWRHLLYYSDNDYAGGEKAIACSSLAVRSFVASDPMDIRAELGRKLAPILQQLSTLDTDYKILGHSWRGNKAYVEIMCRRLRDTLGLHDSLSLDFRYSE